jgi:ferredoxin-NADP reductase
MKVTFDHHEPTARGITTFYFKPNKPIRQMAGQFVELYLPHPQKDKRGERRWFSLSNAPSAEFLSITTKRADREGSSFKNSLYELEPGATVHMSAPMGDFVLPKDPTIPLVFLAGGIGCTPFHSIISELKMTGEDRQILMLYSARTLDEVAYRDTFSLLKGNFEVILQDPPKGLKGLTGRLDADTVRNHFDITPEEYIYISGPEPMVETLDKELKSQGVNKRHIFTDYFPGYLA